jgi:Xaa-Pro dipeptidase
MEQNIYSKRREKMYDYLSAAGFDKALVGEPLTIYYLSGVMLHPYERFMGLVLDAAARRTDAIVPGVDRGGMSDAGIDENVYDDSEGPSKYIKKLLSRGGRVGIEKHYYSIKIGELLSSLGLEMEDVGAVVAQARLRKDEYEIKQLRAAAVCSDKALAAVRGMIKPGVTEMEISLALLCEMARTPDFKPDPYIIQVLTGPRSANPHGISSGVKIAERDVITLDFCGYLNFYWSDYTRTMFVGSVDDEFRKIYGIVLEAQLAAIAASRPGVPASEVDRAARDVITKAGYGEQFIHRTGHGLGLNIHESPYITSANKDTLLENGMVFTIEPGIYLRGKGGVRIEDDILVVPGGCEVLNSYSKRIEDMIIEI